MDILHDSSHRTWYQLGTKYASIIPQYVLDSELQTKEAADALPDELFADPGNRRFPLDSQASTWLSAAYFAKNAEAVGRLACAVESEIKSAAVIWGIDKDVAAIMDAVRSPETVKCAADDDSNYGWVSGDGPGKVRKYPMFDAAGVVKAAAYFSDNRGHYPLAMRRTIAQAIMAKAAEHGVAVADCVRREAGMGMPRRDTLMAELLERAQLCKDAETAAALANINEFVATAPMDELAQELDKIAEIMEMADAADGRDRGYGKRLLSPADVIYDVDPKLAEAVLADSVELARNVFSLSKLAELPLTVYEDALGPDFAGRVKSAGGGVDAARLGDELFSLPRPDKDALERHLEQVFA